MIKTLLRDFSLKENSAIYCYIFPIIDEHKKILQKFLETGYKIEEIRLRESLRDGNIFLDLFENDKFENLQKNLGGNEWILQIYFSHPDFSHFDGPGSFIKTELSHHNFSGSF